ncbi:MAG TPA: SMP-30/gluconolactonase/LRE family protein [Microbacterium sp.]|uniref:SMP-30/gluconolactonase/LRE family protein n=1 Tax=Microbacterium sp. TaxID=51671 RepID=UPI002F924333
MRSRAEPISDRFGQAESPRIDPRSGELLWIDLISGCFHTGRFADGAVITTRSVRVGPHIGAAAPLVEHGAGWIVAAGRDLVHVTDEGCLSPLVAGITPDATRTLNDGVCAPDGSFWVGSQTHPRRPAGALYRIDPSLSVTRVLDAVTVSNGIVFDATGETVYYVDTLPHRRLERFAVHAGGLSGRVTVSECSGGNPDGIALDDDGDVWVAMWDAAEVRRLTSDGRTAQIVPLPVSRPTAVALWEGALLVTTARVPGEELAGGILAVDVGRSAAPTPAFAATIAGGAGVEGTNT